MEPRPARPRPAPLGAACPRPTTPRPAGSGFSWAAMPPARLRSSLPRGCRGAATVVQVFTGQPNTELAVDRDASLRWLIP